MNEYNKILLYNIDAAISKLQFISTTNEPDIWKDISKSSNTELSFDDFLRDLIEFRKIFLNFEKLTRELIESLYYDDGTIFRERLNKYNAQSRTTSNFFNNYYTELLNDIITCERNKISNALPIVNERVYKKAKKRSESIINEICDVMRDDWNISFHPSIDLQAFKYSVNKIVVRSNEEYQIYTEADLSLKNLFYEFVFIINHKKLHICNCKYCGNEFFGSKNSECCNSLQCINIDEKERRKNKRRMVNDNSFENYKRKLSNYIGQQKTKLSSRVLDTPILVEKFDNQRKLFTKQMNDKITEFEAEGLQPSTEMPSLYEKMKQEIVSFVYALEEEAKNTIQ